MPAPSKYKPRFAKQLREGLRKDGKSIEEVCSLWGVTRKTYNSWVEKHPKFAEAHEIGDQDKRAFWYSLQRKVASGESPGNAAVINFALKNEAGYVDKQEVVHQHEEQIRTIKIEMLPTRNQLALESVIEGELVDAEGSES